MKKQFFMRLIDELIVSVYFKIKCWLCMKDKV